MSQIEIENISIELIRKNVRHLNIRILPPNGQVRISAPYLMSMNSIEKFVRSKLNGIIKSQQDVISRNSNSTNLQFNTDKDYKTGDSIYIGGEKYILEILPSTRGNMILNFSNKRANLFSTRNSDVEKRVNYLRKWYANELIKHSLPLFDKGKNITGLYPDKIVPRGTKSVGGTCDKKKKRIMLNAQLATKDIKFLDYVILHELTHLKYANHGEKFKDFMTRYMPNGKQLRKQLNNNL